MPARVHRALESPRFDITVRDHRVALRASPASCIATAHAASTWSPSITSPAASANSARSASPSCETPASAPAAHDLGRHDLGVQRAAPVVDVRAVRLGVDRGDVGAEPPRAASGATSEAAPFAQSTTTRIPSSGATARRLEMREVALAAVARRARGPRRGRAAIGAGSSSAASISSSIASGSFVPVAREELDAVVLGAGCATR